LKSWGIFATVIFLNFALIFGQNNIENQKKLFSKLSEAGQKGRIGNCNVKQLTMPNDNRIIGGYDAEWKEIWIIVEKPDTLFLDSNIDGTVDRVVVNNTRKRASIKMAENELNSFLPFAELAENAEMEADLDPQKISVYSEAMKIDFNTGKISKAGDDMKEQQEAFTSILAEVSQ
jgi:hypothetical protein